jgi:hypothetical protein
MKRRLYALGLASAIGVFLMAGCGPGAREVVEPVEEPPRPTTVAVELREGQTYTVALDLDRSAEQAWEVDFDQGFIELTERSEDAEADAENFVFRARQAGVTEAYFSRTRQHEVIYNFTIGVDPTLAEQMSEEEAREIARASACGTEGGFKDTAFYNDWTGTWWIDMDVEKEGCAPACVVDVKTREAEINWRCTGALPPEESQQAEDPVPPADETPLAGMSLVEEPLASSTRDAFCWYGRVDSTPEGGQFDDYLALLPEESRRAIGVEGADGAIEDQIIALRDSGTYAHFWGTLMRDVPDYGGFQLLVSRLRPEGPDGPFFDPDPVEGWTGTLISTPEDAQFDDIFVLGGSIPMHYGIDTQDPGITAQLAGLRDTGTVIRIWGKVTCPTIDVQGSQILVEQLEVAMAPPPEEPSDEGWVPYVNEEFGYALRYPGESQVMGADLNASVQFAGEGGWPVLTVEHRDSGFYRPPADTEVREWVTDFVMSYDEIEAELEIAGLPAVHLTTYETPQSYAFDEYYFIKGDQLFRILLLHTDGRQDWDLYDRFLDSIVFQ